VQRGLYLPAIEVTVAIMIQDRLLFTQTDKKKTKNIAASQIVIYPATVHHNVQLNIPGKGYLCVCIDRVIIQSPQRVAGAVTRRVRHNQYAKQLV
jgi:hypothetical protein